MLDRLSFVTLNDTIAETFGNNLANVGSGTVPAEREPYKYEGLTVPVHGAQEEQNPYDVGMQLRREARSMFRNRQLCTDGFYMDFATDPELSAWIAVGNASLEYAPGGVSIANFQLNLGQVYLIGTPQMAREGVFVNTQDLGLSTTANDILRTDYTALSQVGFGLGDEGAPRVHLGVNVGDIQGKTQGVGLEIGSYTGINGTGYFVDGLAHGDSLSFDFSTSPDRRKGDVILADRRGNTSPTYTLAGDRKPHLYGWDEIYGPVYTPTAGDVPVIQNDRTRLLFISGSEFQVQTSTGSAFANDGTLDLGFDSIVKVSVVEWRPYRAVLRLNMVSGAGRGVAFLILQKGWAGPQAEVYAQNESGASFEASITYSGTLNQHTNQSDRWQMIRLGAEDSEITWKTVPQNIIVAR